MWNSREMKYERLILLIWDTTQNMSDPFGLGDANIYISEIDKLGKPLMFSLEAGLRRLKYKFETSQYSENDRAFSKISFDKFLNIKTPEDIDEVINDVLKYLENIN